MTLCWPCARTLRGYLEERGELPETPLIAQVPVSQRGADEKDLGNKVASMFASLATDVADPIERVHVIHASTQQAKEMQQALAARRIQTITEATPPGILSIAARTYTAMGLDGRASDFQRDHFQCSRATLPALCVRCPGRINYSYGAIALRRRAQHHRSVA